MRSTGTAPACTLWLSLLIDCPALCTGCLQAERGAAKAASEAAGRSQQECNRLNQRLAEMEDEMKQLLVAVEKQKATSSAKMKQLASLLQDL